jgi:hypothetical protein
MKKFLPLALAMLSFSAVAAGPQFENLTQSDVENVAREFSANFSHTGVSAPETDGLWGLEVGIVGGKSGSPDLSDVVQKSGGNGSDAESLYHAGAMARVHLPLDLFVELNLLPEQELSDLTVKNTSYEVGWNAGGFFSLPLDLAVGINFANSDFSFKQTGTTPATIDLSSKTRIIWAGLSKSFWIFTPYVKAGTVSADTDFEATASILTYGSSSTKDSVSNSGSYLALGANIQLGFLKLGAEYSRIMDVNRTSGKLSFDF